MPTRNASDLAFIIRHNETNYGERYGHTYIEIWPWDHATAQPSPSYVCDTPLTHFTATCQYDTSTHTTCASYGWRWGFKPRYDTMITPQDITEYSALLRITDKRLERLTTQLGTPTSYGEYILHLAKAIGVIKFCWHPPTNNETYRATSNAGDARYYIDDFISRWHTNYNRKQA